MVSMMVRESIASEVSIVVIWDRNVQTELMVEIYPKSLVGAFVKVLLMKCSWNTSGNT